MMAKAAVLLGLVSAATASGLNECETAWGRSEVAGARECFIDNPDLKTNRWGWNNLITGSTELQAFAAAGRCKTENGVYVGTVHVDYDDVQGTVTLRVEAFPGFYYDEYHVYIDKEPFNKGPDGKLSVAPGLFPYKTSEVTVSITLPFYVQVHGVVCEGDPPVTLAPSAATLAPTPPITLAPVAPDTPTPPVTLAPDTPTPPVTLAPAAPTTLAPDTPTPPVTLAPVTTAPVTPTEPPTTGTPFRGAPQVTLNPTNLQADNSECPIETSGFNSSLPGKCTFSKFSCQNATVPWSSRDYRFCGDCPTVLEDSCHMQCPHCADAGTEVSVTCPPNWEACDMFVSVYTNCHTAATDGGLPYNLQAEGWTAGSCGPSFCLPFEATCQSGDSAVTQPGETNIRWEMVLFHKQIGGGEQLIFPQLATDPTMYFTTFVRQGTFCDNSNAPDCSGACQWNPTENTCEFQLCPPKVVPPPPQSPKPCCDGAPGASTGVCDGDPLAITDACDFVLPECNNPEQPS